MSIAQHILRSVRLWLISFAAGLVLCGCGGPNKLAPLTADSVVLAFGDSLTAGTGAEEGESYPAVLALALGCTVVNAGEPGELSEDGLARLPALLKRHAPDLVILCHGGNDMLHKLDDAQIERNMRGMVEAAQRAEADVILLGVPKPGLFLKTPPFYAKVAREAGISGDVNSVTDILSSPALKSDLIHPNAAGYRMLAERVALLIHRCGR